MKSPPLCKSKAVGEVYYVFLLALRLTKNKRKRNPGYVIGTALSGFLRVAGILVDFFLKA
jgi:hypothetical protein